MGIPLTMGKVRNQLGRLASELAHLGFELKEGKENDISPDGFGEWVFEREEPESKTTVTINHSPKGEKAKDS